jgi:hypothetical protein
MATPRSVVISYFLAILLISFASSAPATPPVADAGPDTTMYSGDFITLHGEAWDPDGGTIEVWHWNISRRPLATTAP